MQNSFFYIHPDQILPIKEERHLSTYHNIDLTDKDKNSKIPNLTMRVTSHRIILTSNQKVDEGFDPKFPYFVIQFSTINSIERKNSGFFHKNLDYIVLKTSYGDCILQCKNMEGPTTQIEGGFNKGEWRKETIVKPEILATTSIYEGKAFQMKAQQEKIKEHNSTVTSSFKGNMEDLFENASQLKEITRLLKSKVAQPLQEQEDKESNSILEQMGCFQIITRDDAGDRFYQELAKQIHQTCQQIFPKMGGIIPLIDLFYAVNRKQSTCLISADEILKACQLFQKLGYSARVNTYLNNIKVIEQVEQTEDPLIKIFQEGTGFTYDQLLRKNLYPPLVLRIKLNVYYFQELDRHRERLSCNRQQTRGSAIFQKFIFMINYNFIEFQIQSDSPTTIGRSKIADSQSKIQIFDTYKDISELIDKMNTNIQKIFKRKEEQLIEYYKEEMDHAQQQLKELAELTSDTQLRKKVQHKKEEIENERQKILQSSMEFSNKCKEYKEKLQQVMNITKDLEAEIMFLDDQIQYANQCNDKLKRQLESTQSTDRKILQTITKQPQVATDTQNLEQEIQDAKRYLEKKKSVLEKLEYIQNDSSLELNQLEKIFLESVSRIKNSKQQTDLQNLLMQSKRPRERPEVQAFRMQYGIKSIRFKQEIQKIEDLQHNQFMEEEVQRKDKFFSDIDLNDTHKRMILEDFLSRTEVRMLIYNLLFSGGKINEQIFSRNKPSVDY